MKLRKITPIGTRDVIEVIPSVATARVLGGTAVYADLDEQEPKTEGVLTAAVSKITETAARGKAALRTVLAK